MKLVQMLLGLSLRACCGWILRQVILHGGYLDGNIILDAVKLGLGCCRHWRDVAGLEGVVETLSQLLGGVLLVALLLFEVSLTVALDVLEFVAKCAEVSSN